MRIRYFAAAAAAAGRQQQDLPVSSLPEPTLGALLEHVAELHPAGDRRPEPVAVGAGGPGHGAAPLRRTPSLARVIARSSFLVNEVSVRDRGHPLGEDDVVDVLPPFAGG
ncbi:MoaD/ThiS family protein [Zhihengliuella sp.]|uniref:MoaD/ThiS family protein n=1 Tax=Zhihengliuella sp. TaxID=1954483 RepID=UPI002811BFE8|nr:MoaD/ThiS family protein [Zhihengliuella sp.]